MEGVWLYLPHPDGAKPRQSLQGVPVKGRKDGFPGCAGDIWANGKAMHWGHATPALTAALETGSVLLRLLGLLGTEERGVQICHISPADLWLATVRVPLPLTCFSFPFLIC